jgi:hypothetical protein
MYWLLGCKSKLSIKYKLLIYKTILKPIWGTPSTPNIEILEHFQLEALRMIMDAKWYVPNTVIWKDLQIPMVKHKISRYSYHYSELLSMHPQKPPETR